MQKMSPGGVGDLSICLEGERAGGYRHFNRGAGLLGSEFGCAPPVRLANCRVLSEG